MFVLELSVSSIYIYWLKGGVKICGIDVVNGFVSDLHLFIGSVAFGLNIVGT